MDWSLIGGDTRRRKYLNSTKKFYDYIHIMKEINVRILERLESSGKHVIQLFVGQYIQGMEQ